MIFIQNYLDYNRKSKSLIILSAFAEITTVEKTGMIPVYLEPLQKNQSAVEFVEIA